MTDDAKREIETNKLLASRTLDSLVADREAIRSTISSLGNWLIAASLTINSAGAIAAATAAKQSNGSSGPTLCFAFGIVCVLLCAAAMHQNYMSLSDNAHRQVLLMATIAADGIPTPNLQSQLHAAADRIRKQGFFYIILWIFSIVLFVSGAIGLAQSSVHLDKDNDRRCLWLQHDMLSSQPQRVDSISLFQAFGCHPRGAELPARVRVGK